MLKEFIVTSSPPSNTSHSPTTSVPSKGASVVSNLIRVDSVADPLVTWKSPAVLVVVVLEEVELVDVLLVDVVDVDVVEVDVVDVLVEEVLVVVVVMTEAIISDMLSDTSMRVTLRPERT